MKDFNKIVGSGNVETINLGKLSLPTGEIVVCDPFRCCIASPLSRTVAIGEYAVNLYMKETKSWGPRIIFGQVLFSDQKVIRWEQAVTEDDRDGFSVDAGLAAFMDKETAGNFCDLLNQYRDNHPSGNYYDDVLAKEFKVSAPAASSEPGDWCIHSPFGDEKHNIPMFSSGLGDGTYSAWWGLATDEPVMLTIDFNIA